jgi:multidrug resistance efflux pump
MKKTISLLMFMVLALSLALSACASGPKATPEEIAAAEAEARTAQEQLTIAAREAYEAMETARDNQTPENISAFMVKRDAYTTAQANLEKANANLKKLKR